MLCSSFKQHCPFTEFCHVFTASFTELRFSFKQHCPLTECGHVFTASLPELHWRFTAHHSTAPWAPFDSDLFDIEVLGAVSGWMWGGGQYTLPDGAVTEVVVYLHRGKAIVHT